MSIASRAHARPAAFLAWSHRRSAPSRGSAVALAGLAAHWSDAPPECPTRCRRSPRWRLVARCPCRCGGARPRADSRRASACGSCSSSSAAGVRARRVSCVAATLRRGITPPHLDQWQFPLFPIDANGLLYPERRADRADGRDPGRWLASLACWRPLAPGLAACRRAAVAALLWLAPTASMVVAAARVAAAAAAPRCSSRRAAAARSRSVSTSLRRYYRHTTQAMRLILTFCALLAAGVALYPTASFYADRTARTLIETSTRRPPRATCSRLAPN